MEKTPPGLNAGESFHHRGLTGWQEVSDRSTWQKYPPNRQAIWVLGPRMEDGKVMPRVREAGPILCSSEHCWVLLSIPFRWGWRERGNDNLKKRIPSSN